MVDKLPGLAAVFPWHESLFAEGKKVVGGAKEETTEERTRHRIKVACDTEAVRDGVGARLPSDALVPASDICLWGMPEYPDITRTRMRETV